MRYIVLEETTDTVIAAYKDWRGIWRIARFINSKREAA